MIANISSNLKTDAVGSAFYPGMAEGCCSFPGLGRGKSVAAIKESTSNCELWTVNLELPA
jgi:hypothetical protein